MPADAPEYPLLIIDTSSRRTWVGLKLSANQLFCRFEEQDPSKTLFRLVDELLAKSGLTLRELSSIAFCEGPGSMLGARTTTMAIRTWQSIGIAAANSVFVYNSLQIGAALAKSSSECGESGLVATDARRSSWNVLNFPIVPGQPILLIENEALQQETRKIVSFQEFPAWTKTTAKLRLISYDPTPIFELEAFLPLVRSTEHATPLTIRRNEFKKWDAKIHSAPSQ